MLEDGITPACAGKSWARIFAVYPQQDHPRVCGEKDYGFGAKRLVEGSPPRVRGKVRRGSRQPCRILDHPRVCGEKFQLYNLRRKE